MARITSMNVAEPIPPAAAAGRTVMRSTKTQSEENVRTNELRSNRSRPTQASIRFEKWRIAPLSKVKRSTKKSKIGSLLFFFVPLDSDSFTTMRRV
jgi:hypothetical protein